ncbi:MAG: cysteine desulfurase NifS [Phycisphaerae bacterium]|jgi:cysteine desulfurase
MSQIIYFDNNATTKVADEVVEAMLPFFKDLYANPSSMHSFGGQIEKHIRHGRESLAALLGCDSSEIIFTSGGTESDNAAIKGVLAAYPEKKKIVTTRVEHPAVLATCRELQAAGFSLVELGVDKYGQINLDELADEVDEHTAIVSIMYANNETGVIFPINKIAEIVKSKGAVFHTDAVQAVGKIPLNLDKSSIDLLSLSGHKLHAPKGIGALYVKKGTRILPFIVGGHQEKNRRAGTENVPAIVGLGKAGEIAAKEIGGENTKVRKLRDKLENAILKTCKDAMLNGDKINRLPNTTNISFEFIEGEAILLLLNQFGICASSGSACTSGSLEPSHVMRAMGVPFTAAHGSIRFSLSRYNTEAEVDFVAEKMPPIVNRLRELSPFVK